MKIFMNLLSIKVFGSIPCDAPMRSSHTDYWHTKKKRERESKATSFSIWHDVHHREKTIKRRETRINSVYISSHTNPRREERASFSLSSPRKSRHVCVELIGCRRGDIKRGGQTWLDAQRGERKAHARFHSDFSPVRLPDNLAFVMQHRRVVGKNL